MLFRSRRRWALPRRACRAGGELAGVRPRLGGTDRAVTAVYARERAPQRALLPGTDTVRAIAGRKEAQRPGFFSFRRSLRVVPALSGAPSGVFQRVRYGTCPLATAIVPNRFRRTHVRCGRRRRAGHIRVIPGERVSPASSVHPFGSAGGESGEVTFVRKQEALVQTKRQEE